MITNIIPSISEMINYYIYGMGNSNASLKHRAHCSQSILNRSKKYRFTERSIITMNRPYTLKYKRRK